jgi:hypothetical protein
VLGSRWGTPTKPFQEIANSQQKTPPLRAPRVGLPQHKLLIFAAHPLQAASIILTSQSRHFRPPHQQRRGTRTSATPKAHTANRKRATTQDLRARVHQAKLPPQPDHSHPNTRTSPKPEQRNPSPHPLRLKPAADRLVPRVTLRSGSCVSY